MVQFIPVIYDIAAVILLLMAYSRGAQEGFAKTITNILGHIAAFFGALFVGKIGSALIYSMFLQERTLQFLRQNLMGSVDLSELVDNLQRASASLPLVVRNLFQVSDLTHLEGKLSSSMGNAAVVLEQELIGPAITGFIHIILFLIAFSILSFFAHQASNVVGGVCHLPVIRTADRFLGGLLGLLQGGINLYLIALAARFVLYFISKPPVFFNERIIMDTYIWRWIYQFDPFKFLQ